VVITLTDAGNQRAESAPDAGLSFISRSSWLHYCANHCPLQAGKQTFHSGDAENSLQRRLGCGGLGRIQEGFSQFSRVVAQKKGGDRDRGRGSCRSARPGTASKLTIPPQRYVVDKHLPLKLSA